MVVEQSVDETLALAEPRKTEIILRFTKADVAARRLHNFSSTQAS